MKRTVLSFLHLPIILLLNLCFFFLFGISLATEETTQTEDMDIESESEAPTTAVQLEKILVKGDRAYSTSLYRGPSCQ